MCYDILMIGMKMTINFLRYGMANAVYGRQIREPGARNLPRGAKMQQQRLFPPCADAGDFIKRRGRNGFGAPRAVSRNGEPMRFVAQPLNEI